jgi:hypothetical protein
MAVGCNAKASYVLHAAAVAPPHGAGGVQISRKVPNLWVITIAPVTTALSAANKKKFSTSSLLGARLTGVQMPMPEPG